MSLAKYSFIPWLRQGIVSKINRTEGEVVSTPQVRPQIDVRVVLQSDKSSDTNIDSTISLLGPGDITALNNSAVVRVEPVAGTQSFEPNYFAYIEFYDEELPWRYTPAIPAANKQERLKPWISLVVLKDDQSEFEFTESSQESPAKLTILKSGVLPDLDQSWAWSHCHVNTELNAANLEVAKVDLAQIQLTNPDLAISRILSPRKLDGNSNYRAFLIPTYETGRRSGLGIENDEIDTLEFAWNVGDSNIDFPVYYNWDFSTGSADDDFESLVLKLQAVPVDEKVGTRPMDLTDSIDLLQTFDENYTPSMNIKKVDDPCAVLNLEGALKTTNQDNSRVLLAANDKEVISDFLNLVEDLKTPDGNTSTHPYLGSQESLGNDPVIISPIYGKWHALSSKTSFMDNGWVNELNLDPRERVAAGLGTKVIQDNQENLMDYAWAQVGDVLEANRKLKLAELAEKVNENLLNKHVFTSIEPDRVLRMSGDLHKKIRNNTNSTIHQEILESNLPVGAQQAAFRKIIRANGPFVKKVNKVLSNGTSTAQSIQNTINTSLNQKTVNLYPAPISNNTMIDAAMVASSVAVVNGGNVGTEVVQEDKINNVFVDMQHFIQQPNPPSIPSIVENDITTLIEAALDSTLNVSKQLDKELNLSNVALVPSNSIVKPVMAHPVFPFTTFNYLKKISSDFIIPNIQYIQDNTISLLATNQRFIESFMVGLNHEMARELLWREFPTDQRGTYFKNFWDKTDNPAANTGDIKSIHTWTNLGVNNPSGGLNNVILLLRGELFRKFPNVIIYAQKAKWQLKVVHDFETQTDKQIIDVSKPRLIDETSSILFPTIQGQVDPDINLIGFELTAAEAKGYKDENLNPNQSDAGYFFILKERSGQIRFGFDNDIDNNPEPYATWDGLNKSHLGTDLFVNPIALEEYPSGLDPQDPTWNSDSADIASILYQSPVMVAFHASDMLSSLN